MTSKRRTNVSLDAGLLADARSYRLNVSAISEAALRDAVAEAKAREWREENADTREAHRRWIAENGMPLARWQVLKTE